MALGDCVSLSCFGVEKSRLGEVQECCFKAPCRLERKKSVYLQLRRGQEWQKFMKVFREVKAVLMQITQGGRFNQLGAGEGSVPLRVEKEHKGKHILQSNVVFIFTKTSLEGMHDKKFPGSKTLFG